MPLNLGISPPNFYKRHKAAVIGAAAFVATLSLGFIVTGVMYQKELKARELAQLESQKSRETIWFLTETLSSAGYSKSLGRDAAMMQDLLQDALKRIREDETMKPEVEDGNPPHPGSHFSRP